MSGSVDKTNSNLLALRSGNTCAMPDCRTPLSQEETTAGDKAVILGEMAHIKGEKDGSARYDSTQPSEERNKYPNLIYLCPTCHTKIDKQEMHYTVDLLQQIKNDHEKWVRKSLRSAMPEVTFKELSIVTQHLLSDPGLVSVEFDILDVAEKMQRNNLTEEVKEYIQIGLAKLPKVQEYVDLETGFDISFPEKLKAGFLNYYYAQIIDGLNGNELFEAMQYFASGGSTNFKVQAAGVAVLVYLFVKCEVFEK